MHGTHFFTRIETVIVARCLLVLGRAPRRPYLCISLLTTALLDADGHREAMTHDGWFTGSKRVNPASLATLPLPSPYATLWGGAAAAAFGGGGDGKVFPGEEGGVSFSGGGGKLVPSSSSSVAVAAAAARATAGDGDHHQNSFTLDHQHTLNLQHSCPKV